MDKEYTGFYTTVTPTATEQSHIYGKQITGETYTRDYWLKRYAGMALPGLLADPDLSVERSVTLAAEAAHKLVDEMFKDEESPRIGSDTTGPDLGTHIQ